MTNWQFLLVFGAVFGLVLVWLRAVGNLPDSREEFSRKLDSLLQPTEKILVECPQKNGCCVLTNLRIFVKKKGKYTGFFLKDLQSVQGKNKDGNRTTVPGNMATLTVRFPQELVLKNTGPEFEEIARQLQSRIKKQREKAAKTAKKK